MSGCWFTLVENKKNEKYNFIIINTKTQECFEYNRPLSKKAISYICKVKNVQEPNYENTNNNCLTNIYFISCGELIKIGKADDVKSRLNQLQLMNANKINLLYYFQATPKHEFALHKKFKKYKSHGEWFYFSDEIKQYIENSKKGIA